MVAAGRAAADRLNHRSPFFRAARQRIVSVVATLRDALAGELARHLSDQDPAQHDSLAAEFRTLSEDYRTLSRMHYLPDYAADALQSARALPGGQALDPFILLRTISDAYDIAAALRKH